MSTKVVRLTQAQFDVLLWIRDGCQPGVYGQGYEHRIRARTLERRGLVTIRGQGDSWRASVTDAGRSWKQVATLTTPPSDVDADDLITRVLEADGYLVLPDDRTVEEKHERLIRASLRSDLRPKGKKLEMVSTGSLAGMRPQAIEFTEYFDDFVEERPVPVPERVREYHPVVRSFVGDKEWQFVTKDHLPRASRVLQAIACEAELRGIDVLSPTEASRGLGHYEAQRMHRAHLALRTPAGIYTIQIREIPGRGGQKTNPARYGARKSQPSWLEYRQFEFIGTGRLELVVNGPGTSYSADHYRDLKAARLEDRLPAIFRFFEIHKLRTDREEEKRQQKAATRRLQWESAMAQAKLRYLEQSRWQRFEECSRTWQAVNAHRAFITAAKTSAATYGQPSRDALIKQLELAEQRLDELDPIAQLEQLTAEIPEPKPADLQPFLNGWSPHGPDGHP